MNRTFDAVSLSSRALFQVSRHARMWCTTQLSRVHAHAATNSANRVGRLCAGGDVYCNSEQHDYDFVFYVRRIHHCAPTSAKNAGVAHPLALLGALPAFGLSRHPSWQALLATTQMPGQASSPPCLARSWTDPTMFLGNCGSSVNLPGKTLGLLEQAGQMDDPRGHGCNSNAPHYQPNCGGLVVVAWA